MSTRQNTLPFPSVQYQETESVADLGYANGCKAVPDEVVQDTDAYPAEPEPTPEEEEAHRQHYVTGRLADLSSFVLMLTIAAARNGDAQLSLGGCSDHAEYLTYALQEAARRGLVAEAGKAVAL